jgi:uncharacterized MAPEG superfamily protein
LLQVFIRTVNKHTPTGRRGSSAQHAAGASTQEEVYQEVNRCGCTRSTTQIFTILTAILLIVFWIIGGFVFQQSAPGVASLFYLAGFVCLIVSFVGCNLLCCACCRPATGADE